VGCSEKACRSNHAAEACVVLSALEGVRHLRRGSGMSPRRHSADLRGRRHDLGIGVRDMASGSDWVACSRWKMVRRRNRIEPSIGRG
jgi:hypothetical protein